MSICSNSIQPFTSFPMYHKIYCKFPMSTMIINTHSTITQIVFHEPHPPNQSTNQFINQPINSSINQSSPSLFSSSSFFFSVGLESLNKEALFVHSVVFAWLCYLPRHPDRKNTIHYYSHCSTIPHWRHSSTRLPFWNFDLL